jgi:metal-dependent amidase/aminoacylase/carboxypeptidase family protein
MTISRTPKKADTASIQRLKTEVNKIIPDMVKVRHTIHQNPEIALKERSEERRVGKEC